ncbi:MAG: fumarylacetoacetase [Gemmatimonadaceae bacterium]|nr:fumarylacetoacetase [Gemmatimonadaceae bacterium]
MTDATHDPARLSWVHGANDPATDFPIQNLPFGVFRRRGSTERARVGVAIGDMVLDVTDAAARSTGHFAGNDEAIVACDTPSLNALMALGRRQVAVLRESIANALDLSNGVAQHELSGALIPMADVDMLMPAQVGDYTDFYASVYHATNVGSMFRPDNALLPNYKYVPIGYHGRASSIVPSGTPVIRPAGQRKGPTDAEPTVGPSRSLDYECEVGVFIGKGSAMGETIALESAEEHLFGVALVNDWSARDVQSWEYQPLGPFLAKNFATTVSPWVVTLDALAPFRAPAFARAAGDPAPLPYLTSAANEVAGGVDITLEVRLQTAAMRARGEAPVAVSRTSFTHMYWTLAQLLTHHAMGGCNMRPGDLLASGTVSGPTKGERGCLLELTWRGSEPLVLPSGETRAFLEDEDLVELAGWCEAPGQRRIGFGTCSGLVTSC